MPNNPYVFFIYDRETLERNLDSVLSEKLRNAGYDVGPMIWTDLGVPYPNAERKKNWMHALKRAGITYLEEARDEQRMGRWFKVLPHPSSFRSA